MQPILKEDTRARGTTKKISKINVDSPLHCPHDLSKSNEFRDDLPVLLDKTLLENNVLDKGIEIEAKASVCSVFNTVEEEIVEVKILSDVSTFVCNYFFRLIMKSKKNLKA